MGTKRIYRNDEYELIRTKWHYHLSANPNSGDWEVATFFDKIKESGQDGEYYLVMEGCGEVGMTATSSMPKELCDEIERLPKVEDN